MTIRIMLADDHTILREGIRVIVDLQDDMEVVSEAADGRDAVVQYLEHQPDVLVLDLHMPELEGAGVIEAIRAQHADARVLVLTTYDGDEDVYRSLKAGAAGYLLKDTPREELLAAIRSVAAGGQIVPPSIAAIAIKGVSAESLTGRELEVLRLVAEGCSNAKIADELHVAEGTVKTHVNNILSKLESSGRTEAVTTAIRRGLIRV